MRASQPVDNDVVTSPEPATGVIDDPTQHVRTRRHPRWCDRQRCVTDQGAARHVSAATRLATAEQMFTLTLVQHDPHDPELLVEVTDTADPDGLQVLTLPEIKALAETLLIEYLRAACRVSAARHPVGSTVATAVARHMP